METALIIIGTMVFDWGLSLVIHYNKKKQLKRDEDLFLFKLEQILNDPTLDQNKRFNKAKWLCRETEGKISAGAYFAIDSIKE